MKVIGFTGFFGAGKGTVISIVSRLTGAPVFSTSEEVAEECKRRGMPTDRPTKYAVANDVREKLGPGEFSKRVVKKIRGLPEGTGLALVDALRTQGEVQVLKDAFGKEFALVSVEAPQQMRYERVLARARDAGDTLPYEAFLESERRENKPDAKEFEQSLGTVAKLADHRIQNDCPLPELEKRVKAMLGDIGTSKISTAH